ELGFEGLQPIRARLGGRRFVWLWLGDVVVNQVGWRLDMVVRGRSGERLLPASHVFVENRLLVDSQRLGDEVFSLQIEANHGSESKDVAAGVAVALGPLGRKLLKTDGELCQYNFLVGLRDM